MPKVFLLLIVSVLLLGLALAQSPAKLDVIQQLLDLPAPRPENSREEEWFDLTDYNEKTSPPDNAPFNVLEAYWSNDEYKGEKEIPLSVRLRFLEEAEKHPAELPRYLQNNLLPDTSEAHTRIKTLLDNGYRNYDDYDDEEAVNRVETEWKQKVREWLMKHTKFFLDELEQKAGALVEGETEVKGSAFLAALARLDWERAKPIVAGYTAGAQPLTATFALTLQYQNATANNDSSATETLRTRLKALVEDKFAPTKVRDLACATLVQKEWDGRDEWFVSLFTDESLRAPREGEHNVYHPLRDALQSDPDHWIPVIAKLVGHSNRTIHDTAVETLAELEEKKLCKEALLPLLPWLTNRHWSAADNRTSFVQGLRVVPLPEALFGLLTLIDTEGKAALKPAARSNQQQTEEDVEIDEDLLRAAIEAVGEYKDARAIPALKRALLRETDKEMREAIITSLHACGGLSDDEIVKGIEAFAARAIVTGEDLDELMKSIRDDYFEFEEEENLPVKVNIGQVFLREESPREVWGTRLLERIEVLRKSQPGVARLLLAMVQDWSLRVVDAAVVQHIGDGKADVMEIDTALQARERLAESVGDELQMLVRKGGASAGLAAVLLDDSSLQHALLQGTDKEAIRALLAAARLVRTPLPIEEVGQYLSDARLGLAAERYLESEDSPAARAMVLAKHPGEALILGAREDFAVRQKDGNHWAEFIREKHLRNEILRPNGPEEIIALLSSRVFRRTGDLVLRMRQDKAELTWYKDAARDESRTIEASELQELRSFLAENAVENLPPFVRYGHHGSEVFEYVRITRDGGRRVYVMTPHLPKKSKEIHLRLVQQFLKLTESKPFKLRYALKDRLPGMEVLMADDSAPVQAVWQDGNELRVAIGSEWKAMWYVVTEGKLSANAATPAPYAAEQKNQEIPDEIRRGVSWVQAVGEEFIYQPYSFKVERPGLMKVTLGNAPLFLTEGQFKRPLVTPDGKWLLALKEHSDPGPDKLVRIDLHSGQEFRMNLPPDKGYEPVTYVPLQEKWLVRQPAEKGAPTYYFVAPLTGALEAVKGEVAPLTQVGARFLQPTRNRDEFWAAIYSEKNKVTEIGRYNLRTFAFTPTQSIPELKFDSMKLWVDEAGQRIYVVYNGHLLRLPLQP